MQLDLEKGFANQQTTLLHYSTRGSAQGRSRAADESDRQIMVAENLISAYKRSMVRAVS